MALQKIREDEYSKMSCFRNRRLCYTRHCLVRQDNVLCKGAFLTWSWITVNDFLMSLKIPHSADSLIHLQADITLLCL